MNQREVERHLAAMQMQLARLKPTQLAQLRRKYQCPNIIKPGITKRCKIGDTKYDRLIAPSLLEPIFSQRNPQHDGKAKNQQRLSRLELPVPDARVRQNKPSVPKVKEPMPVQPFFILDNHNKIHQN